MSSCSMVHVVFTGTLYAVKTNISHSVGFTIQQNDENKMNISFSLGFFLVGKFCVSDFVRKGERIYLCRSRLFFFAANDIIDMTRSLKCKVSKHTHDIRALVLLGKRRFTTCYIGK